jgi:hypothetical protein
MNVMQEELILLFSRNLTEAVRLLFSGYMAVLLCRFSKIWAIQCRSQLVVNSKNDSQIILATKENIEKAWAAREQALHMTCTIQKEFGFLLTIIVLSDLVSLNSTLADSLLERSMTIFLRNGVTVLVFLVSTLTIASGLINLTDEVINIIWTKNKTDPSKNRLPPCNFLQNCLFYFSKNSARSVKFLHHLSSKI